MAVIIPFRRRAVSFEPVETEEACFTRCPLCSEWFDLGDLNAALSHLHGAPLMMADNDDDDDDEILSGASSDE